MILKNSFFSTETTVGVQWEDGGPYTHGMIVEPNGSHHRGFSYTIQVTKTDRLITHNTKCKHVTTISSEHYLWEQIKEVALNLEDIFMQAVPLEAARLPKLQELDNRTEATQYKVPGRGRQGQYIPYRTR